jgi:hypothetical protein
MLGSSYGNFRNVLFLDLFLTSRFVSYTAAERVRLTELWLAHGVNTLYVGRTERDLSCFSLMALLLFHVQMCISNHQADLAAVVTVGWADGRFFCSYNQKCLFDASEHTDLGDCSQYLTRLVSNFSLRQLIIYEIENILSRVGGTRDDNNGF